MTGGSEPREWSDERSLRFAPFRPDPPIYIAGFGSELLRLGGAIGDGVLPMATPPESVGLLAQDVRDGAARVGRDTAEVQIVACVWLSIGVDGGAAAVPLRRLVATFGPYLEERALATVGLAPGDFAEIRRLGDEGRLADAVAAVTPGMLRLALVGTAEEAAERILALGEAGVTSVSLGGALGDDPREAIRLVGEVIAPACREGQPG